MIIQSGIGTVSGNDTEWKLNQGSGNRSWDRLIHFPKPFGADPKVIVSIFAMDTDFHNNQRFQISAEEIQRNNFQIRIITWNNSLVHYVGYTWLAYDSRLETTQFSKILNP